MVAMAMVMGLLNVVVFQVQQQVDAPRLSIYTPMANIIFFCLR